MKQTLFIAGILFTIIFTLFAYWQLNDPDPILWVPVYGSVVYVSAQAILGKVKRELVSVLFILSLMAGIQLWSEMTAWEGFMTDGLAMKTMNQELAREAVGLWICSAALALFYSIDKLK